MTQWLNSQLSGREDIAMRVVVDTDCLVKAFDSRRAGHSSSAQLMDARLKEACRHHRCVQQAMR